MARSNNGVLGTSGVLGLNRTMAYVKLGSHALYCLIDAHAENYMEHPQQSSSLRAPGALGLGQAMSTRVYCAFYIFYYTVPIAVSVISDSYLGRYNTLVIVITLYCLGCVILTVSSLPSSLEREFGVPGLAISMVLIGLGAGGFRAIAVPFMADQQHRTQPKVKMLRTGDQVVTDDELTLQYVYNLYYW
jgi:POT family proton-dependent oligopeptide transporter